MTTPDLISDSADQKLGPPPEVGDVAEIASNTPESFGWNVLRERHPALIGQIRAALPYEPRQLAQLDRLLEEITIGVVRPVPPSAFGAVVWNRWAADWIGRRWEDIGFLSAESLFYAKLLDAVDFWGPGPWRGIDPFEFAKSRELASTGMASDLRSLDAGTATPTDARTRTLILASLWGNQADLGFRIGASTPDDRLAETHLVVDDTDSVIRAAVGGQMDKLCLIADNAGRELAADLVLVDHLLHTGAVTSVDLHLKPHPYYVSDATAADLVAVLRRLTGGPAMSASVAMRLSEALHGGQLSIYTHWFYGAPFTYHRMPADLRERISRSDFSVVKGDLNYRRLVGDYWWPPTIPFARTTGYFPTSLAALRTLKSNVIVGLDDDRVVGLDATGMPWRTNGTYGLVQVRS